MIQVISTNPLESATSVYIDQEISIQFDKHIKQQYITSEYFKLYLIDSSSGVDKYSLFNSIITDSTNNTVKIKPAFSMSSNRIFKVLVRGDLNISDGTPSGIRSDDDDLLDGNFILTFTTGTESTPVQGSSDPTYDVSGNINEGTVNPIDKELKVISSSIVDMTYNVETIDTIDIIFNENVIVDSLSSVSIQTRSLDPALLPLINMNPTNIAVSGVMMSVDVDGTVCMSGTAMTVSDLCNTLPYNHEYTLTINPNYIVSEDGSGLSKPYEIQFSSMLFPMYATVYEIREESNGFIDDNIPDYLIAKIIFKNSKYISVKNNFDYYHSTSISTELSNKFHDYVICKTLYDLLTSPKSASSTFGARISSKSLGDFSISYDYGKNSESAANEFKDQLKQCYTSILYGSKVRTTVKSKGDIYYPGRRRAVKRTKSDAYKLLPYSYYMQINNRRT